MNILHHDNGEASLLPNTLLAKKLPDAYSKSREVVNEVPAVIDSVYHFCKRALKNAATIRIGIAK